jgi:spermidine synthase
MPYLRSAAVGLTVPPRIERILMIGLGGGAFATFARTRSPQVVIDTVEIDPMVARVAVDYFGLEAGERLRLHVEDAVDYVAGEHGVYDYILLDAYDAKDLPEALVTHAFLSDVRDLLASDGVVVANIAVRSDYKARRVITKLAGLFTHCLRMRSTPSLNDVLLLTEAPLPPLATLEERLRPLAVDGETAQGMREHLRAAGPCL